MIAISMDCYNQTYSPSTTVEVRGWHDTQFYSPYYGCCVFETVDYGAWPKCRKPAVAEHSPFPEPEHYTSVWIKPVPVYMKAMFPVSGKISRRIRLKRKNRLKSARS